jgi:spermidine synthase
VEELAHFVILSHEDPKELLILSGGAGGLIKEILKYNIERVDYAELDPTLIQLIKKFPNELTEEELGDSRLHIKNIDGRRFVRLANHKYDVILTNLPFPSTLQLNRFYTEEFFRDIKYLLKENGIFAFHLAGSLSYIGSELRNLNGSILNTLKNAFAYVRIIPGDSNLYLASKSSFQVEPNIFISRIKKRGIPTKMISDAYLRYRLDTGWLSWFTNSMGDLSQIRRNLDLLPSAVFYSLSYWNAQFSQKLQVFFGILDRLRFRFLLILIGLIGLILFLCQRAFPRLKRLSIGFAICTTGFTGMSVNLIAIFTYQSFYGFIFQHFALLTMAFMAGLSLGSWIITRKINQAEIDIFFFLKVEFVLVAFCAALGPLLFYLDKAPAENLAFIFFILQALVGFLVGVEFPLANKIYWRNREGHSQGAGFLYGLDLMGSWSATLIVGIALVPIIGIVKTSILLAAIKLTSLILIITSSKRSLLC